jgi:hypothetical protein
MSASRNESALRPQTTRRRRRRLRCPRCGASTFTWITYGTREDLVAILDDGSAKDLEVGEWDGDSVDVECSECGWAVNDEELVR